MGKKEKQSSSKPTRRQASQAEKHERVKEAYALCLRGSSSSRTVQFITDKYQISVRQAWNYLALAYRMIARTKEARKNDYDREIAIARYEDILDESRKKGDRKNAIRAQARIDSLRGMEVQKIEHSGKMETTHKMDLTGLSDEELEILARRGVVPNGQGKPGPGGSAPDVGETTA